MTALLTRAMQRWFDWRAWRQAAPRDYVRVDPRWSYQDRFRDSAK